MFDSVTGEWYDQILSAKEFQLLDDSILAPKSTIVGKETVMASSGGQKLVTLSQVPPGGTASGTWNNAVAEVYSLQVWPVVAPGVDASAEITKTRYVVHGNPSERELHFWVKNTGSTQVDIAVWAFWWNQ